MSSHSLERDGPENERTTPGECASCGESELVELTDVPSSICSVCGFSPETGAEVPTPPEQNDEESSEVGTWDEYYSVSNGTEQNIATAFGHLEALADKLHLSVETRLQVADVYAAASRENLTDGRPTSLVVAASLCIGSREAEVPRPSKKVAQACELDSRTVKRTIRTFQRELNRGFLDASASAYLGPLCNEMDLDSGIEQKASELISRYESEEGCSGNHPAGIAGAALYVTADGLVTQRKIAASTGTSKETIRVRVADIRGVE